MKNNKPQKQILYRISIFTSLYVGILVYGIISIVQFFLFESFPAQLLWADFFTSLTIAGIVYLMCLLNILLRQSVNNKDGIITKKVIKASLFTYAISLLLGWVGLFILGEIYKNAGYHSQLGMINILKHQPHFIWSVFALLFGLVFINGIIQMILSYAEERNRQAKLEYENALLKVENVKTSYLQLRQQVNPHFLFNALNILKILIRKKPDKAEVYLSKLSGFLRQSVKNDIKPAVTVEEELAFCLDYMALQEMRFGEALHFTENIPDDIKTGLIPVFSIQQLLENAIKHNSLTVESPLVITLQYENQWITVKNNLQIKPEVEESSRTGLANLSERYRLLSGNEIMIESNDEFFSVSIKVLSDEDCNYRG